MSWSLNMGKIFGINLRIHITFFLLLILIFVSGYSQEGFEKAIRATLFICAVFACVLIHEIGKLPYIEKIGFIQKSGPFDAKGLQESLVVAVFYLLRQAFQQIPALAGCGVRFS